MPYQSTSALEALVHVLVDLYSSAAVLYILVAVRFAVVAVLHTAVAFLRPSPAVAAKIDLGFDLEINLLRTETLKPARSAFEE